MQVSAKPGHRMRTADSAEFYASDPALQRLKDAVKKRVGKKWERLCRYGLFSHGLCGYGPHSYVPI